VPSGIERLILLFRGRVELGCGFEVLLFLSSALLLKTAQFGCVFFGLAVKTRKLELQIPELLFVGEKSVEFDQPGA
jgi:hypothetical protein